jgi:hypothetical protein
MIDTAEVVARLAQVDVPRRLTGRCGHGRRGVVSRAGE